MEVAAPSKTHEPLGSDKALSAVVALLVAEREDRIATNGGNARKTDSILAASGLSAAEIAPLVGKNLGAVRKTIERGKIK